MRLLPCIVFGCLSLFAATVTVRTATVVAPASTFAQVQITADPKLAVMATGSGNIGQQVTANLPVGTSSVPVVGILSYALPPSCSFGQVQLTADPKYGVICWSFGILRTTTNLLVQGSSGPSFSNAVSIDGINNPKTF